MAPARMAAAVAALFLAAPASASVLRGSTAVDWASLAHMQPQVVSHLLGEVERQWEASALAVMQGKADAKSSLEEMKGSCNKVSEAIVSGSEGNKDKVVDYLREVCESDTGAEDKAMCKIYATALEAHMTNDLYTNREDLNIPGFCEKFYAGAVQEAAKKKQAALEADAKEEKLSADAKAVAEKKATDAKAQEELKAKEAATARATHEDVQHVTDMVAKAQQHFATAVAHADAKAEGASTQSIVEHARKALQVADEKETAEAEAAAKAAQAKVDEIRARAAEKKAEAQKANADEKTKASLLLVRGHEQGLPKAHGKATAPAPATAPKQAAAKVASFPSRKAKKVEVKAKKVEEPKAEEHKAVQHKEAAKSKKAEEPKVAAKLQKSQKAEEHKVAAKSTKAEEKQELKKEVKKVEKEVRKVEKKAEKKVVNTVEKKVEKKVVKKVERKVERKEEEHKVVAKADEVEAKVKKAEQVKKAAKKEAKEVKKVVKDVKKLLKEAAPKAAAKVAPKAKFVPKAK